MLELKAIFAKWDDRLVMGGNLYSVVCIILVIVAALLRFYELPENSLRYDEARVANQARGTLSEVISNTRYNNSAPILYPLILYAVQTVDRSSLSVRIVPATTSVLTIVVLLFLLPRVGVSRSAAFLAALMAAFSSKAIEHAQDVREYSIDAFVAALLIAGLLAYLRNAKKVLLCTSLFIAPLIQYGLVIFCFSILAAIWSLSLGFKRASWVSTMGRACKKSICPCAFFAVGSVITYAVTVRHQWQEGGWGSNSYLAWYYYRGEYRDVWSIFEFIDLRMWELLNYHLTETIAILALVAVGVLLYGCFRKSQIDPILVLCIFALASAAGAAVLRAYPCGGIRQCIYLGPILFLGVGHALHRATNILFPRRLRLICLTLVANIVAFCGIASIRADDPYREIENPKGVLIALEEQAKEEDVIYVPAPMIPFFQFYLNRKPDNYYYRGCISNDSTEKCVEDIVNLMNLEYSLYPSSRKRMYLVISGFRAKAVLQMLKDRWSVDGKEVFRGKGASLLLINLHRLANRAELGDPISESDNYEIYLKYKRLVYVKKTEKCGNEEDSGKKFFIYIHPVDERDIRKENEQFGYDYIEFDPGLHRSFRSSCYHFEIANQCVVECPLPEYDIDYIRTGQYTSAGALWETKLSVRANRYKAAYRSIVAEEPVIRSHFDIYLNGDTLSYVKEPCAVGDTEARFFFDLIPVNQNQKDLPDHRKQHGYHNATFQFEEKGVRFDETCIARVALPEYEIDYIRTGQYASAGTLWETKLSVRVNKYKAAYRSIVAEEPVIRSHFDVYLNGDTLSYVKEPCAVSDTEARFFIATYPLDTPGLPDHRKQHGYDNATFQFEEKGVRFDETCIARVVLPEYDIKFIKTGQLAQDGSAYREAIYDFDLNDLYDLIAASNEPIIRSVFDVYLRNNTLSYLKEPCTPDDTEQRFFLHFTPTDENDLLDHRKPHGFANHDFRWQGTHFDGRCMAQVVIPQYDFRHLRTGQYISIQGAIHDIWREDFFLGSR